MIEYIDRVLDPPGYKTLDEVGEPIERTEFKKTVDKKNYSNSDNDTQDQVFYCPASYQASVEARVCHLLGLQSYSINNYMIRHRRGKREAVRSLDTMLNIVEVMHAP